MKSKTKPILAAAGYLWGGALLTLLVSLAVTMVYRTIAGGKNAEEYLAVGLITLPVQLLFGFFAFSRFPLIKRNVESENMNATRTIIITPSRYAVVPAAATAMPGRSRRCALRFTDRQ